jgi:hypothetical protein
LINITLNLKSNTLKPEDKRFNQWLAGLIDGAGCFQLSTKAYATLDIVVVVVYTLPLLGFTLLLCLMLTPSYDREGEGALLT